MSGIKIRSLRRERIHKEKVIAKLEKLRMLKANLDTWESMPNPDYDYLRELRARIRSVETQYNAMA
jgi:capsule polysaccharide export protein KpsE/RkpR